MYTDIRCIVELCFPSVLGILLFTLESPWR